MRLRRLIAFSVFLVMIAGLLAPGQLAAHGIGLPQVVNVPSGPYLLSVWTDPDPLREDEMHVVVAVMDPQTRAPLVEDLTVSVRMVKQDGEREEVIATALSDNSANQLLYVVEFNDQVSAGPWEATVIIEGPKGTASDVAFPLAIDSARGFNWLWVGVAGLVISVVGWLFLASRKPTPARDTAPPRP